MYKTIAFALYVSTLVLSGVVEHHANNEEIATALVLLLAVLSSFFAFMWYHKDAAQTKTSRSRSLDISVAGLAVLALPYYFFKSRGFKQGVLATVLYFSLLLALGFMSSNLFT